jgi:hypothetical protein
MKIVSGIMHKIASCFFKLQEGEHDDPPKAGL